MESTFTRRFNCCIQKLGDIENFQKYYEKSSEINTVATDFYLILGFKLLIVVDDITFARDCFLKQLKFEKKITFFQDYV